MARWIPSPDPTSQVQSRAIPFESGIIAQNTTVQIPETLNNTLRRTSPELQNIYDYLVMRMSHIFTNWKGTKLDFRFANSAEDRVFVLTPNIKFLRVEIRANETGYNNNQNLFPDVPTASSRYPVNTLRADITQMEEAVQIADSIERSIL